MDDIRRQDQRLLIREMCQPWRIIFGIGGALMSFAAFSSTQTPFFFMAGAVCIGGFGLTAWKAAERRKFTNKRLESLWSGCRDRHMRFEDVLKKMSREQIADLQEMPNTIHKVAINLYAALRRADLILAEVQLTEQGLYNQPPTWTASPADAQSKELYRIADKNIAEYRTQFAGVLAGVQRTEAQSAVFMTTLDSLRMKMLNYRLVGRSPELNSGEFLSALAEARAQLQSIDQALDELDLGHYPRTISTTVPEASSVTAPPAVPDGAIEDAIARLKQGQS